MVPGASPCLENRPINALSVVPDAQPKPPLLIADFHVDPLCLGVREGIAHRLACNPKDFVPDERRKIPRRSFHVYAELGTSADLIRREFGGESLSNRVDRA